jgi:hypothetical protein
MRYFISANSSSSVFLEALNQPIWHLLLIDWFRLFLFQHRVLACRGRLAVVLYWNQIRHLLESLLDWHHHVVAMFTSEDLYRSPTVVTAQIHTAGRQQILGMYKVIKK